MAHRKAGGTAKNLRDSNPQYLGIKLFDGERAKSGSIIVRQRGTPILAGNNTRLGKDHTIFALDPGVVRYATTRRKRYDGKTVRKRIVHVDTD